MSNRDIIIVTYITSDILLLIILMSFEFYTISYTWSISNKNQEKFIYIKCRIYINYY